MLNCIEKLIAGLGTNNKLLTEEEISLIKYNKEIDFIENCGRSKEYNDYNLYNIVLNNGSIYNIYIK